MDEEKPRPDWLSQLTPNSAPLDLVEQFARHVVNPQPRWFVDERGEASIGIPKSWLLGGKFMRDPKDQRLIPIPPAVPHTKSLPLAQQEAARFSKPFRSKDLEDGRNSYILWLSAEMLGNHYSASGELAPSVRQEVEAQVAEVCEALEAKHAISALEHRIYYPPAPLRQALGHRAFAAVVMAVPPREISKLDALQTHITNSRTKAEIITAETPPEPAKTEMKRITDQRPPGPSWESRFGKISGRGRHDQNIADIARFTLAKPKILPVTQDRVLVQHPIDPEEAETVQLSSDKVEHAHPPTHALVVHFSPDLRTPVQEMVAGTPVELQDPLPRDLDRFVDALESELQCDLSMVPCIAPQANEPISLIFCADCADQPRVLRELTDAMEYYAAQHTENPGPPPTSRSR